MIPRAIIFDLDNTLAESKAAITPQMAALLAQLMARMPVAIISGGMLEQLATQAGDQLPAEANRSNFYLLPTSGGALHVFEDGAWRPVYEELLSNDEAARITEALEKTAKDTGVLEEGVVLHGPQIEYRGAQVSFSALGQRAPLALKEAWDPTREKRIALEQAASQLLPEFDVKSGGLTTIDVTRHGVNKAFGLRRLAEHLGIPLSDMLYVGDALYAGGNDEVVKETGIPTRSVSGPADTATLIAELLTSP